MRIKRKAARVNANKRLLREVLPIVNMLFIQTAPGSDSRDMRNLPHL